jgi:hypothetical protein
LTSLTDAAANVIALLHSDGGCAARRSPSHPAHPDVT